MGNCITVGDGVDTRRSPQVLPAAARAAATPVEVSVVQRRAAELVRPLVSPGEVHEHYTFVQGGTLGMGCAGGAASMPPPRRCCSCAPPRCDRLA